MSSSFGRSFRLSVVSRYSVTTVASRKSTSKRSPRTNRARSATPSMRALRRLVSTRSELYSMPRARAPNRFAAAITILPSPEPRSTTRSLGITRARISIRSTAASGVGTQITSLPSTIGASLNGSSCAGAMHGANTRTSQRAARNRARIAGTLEAIGPVDQGVRNIALEDRGTVPRPQSVRWDGPWERTASASISIRARWKTRWRPTGRTNDLTRSRAASAPPCARRARDPAVARRVGARAGVAGEAGAHRVPLLGRRPGRRAAARPRAAHVRVDGAAVRGREPDGRERDHRRGGGGALGPRWLHAAFRFRRGVLAQPAALLQTALRREQGLRADRAGDQRLPDAGRPHRPAAEGPEGAVRLHQGEQR